jgi:hypothetical protein
LRGRIFLVSCPESGYAGPIVGNLNITIIWLC